mgnify:CR=1 FL=1
MGISKALMEKVAVAASRNSKDTVICLTRYGNVMASRGSVIPLFVNQVKCNKPITITDPNMTRFNISINDGAKMVFFALKNARGGEIFVPKIPSYRILDLAEAVCPKCEKHIVGIRPGEKIHEEMITSSDSFNTYDIGKYYVILPNQFNWSLKDFIDCFGAKKVKENFSYNSGDNDNWETVNSLSKLIKSLK